MTESAPKRSVVGGAAWMVAARFIERLIGLGSTLILARLLSPDDFGLVAMAMVFVAGAELLGAFGLDWALVRQPGLDRTHLDTGWTLRALLGLASMVVLVALAGPAADFYGEPRIEAMVMVLGASLAIGALENTGIIMYRREMNFEPEFKLRATSKVLGGVVAITVAVIYQSYWALLLGTLTSRLTATTMSYVLHPHRPRPTLAARRDLLGFSTWLWLANILGVLRTKSVELVLGRIAGPRPLGLFTISSEISQLATSELAAPINRALFSSYSASADQPRQVGSAYQEATPVVWAVTLPIVVGTFLIAPQLVRLMLGPQWLEAVSLLRILAAAAVPGLLSAGAILVYWAVNRPKLETAVEAAWVAFLIVSVALLVPRLGVTGAAIAVLASNLLLAPIHVYLLARIAHVSFATTVRRSWRIAASCAVMCAALWPFAGAWNPSGNVEALQQLLILATLGAGIYASSLFGLWKLSGSPEGPERVLLRLVEARRQQYSRRAAP